MSLVDDLRGWRSERRIVASATRIYVENVIEELLEIYHTDKWFIKDRKDKIMATYFSFEPLDTFNTIDAIQDVTVFSINETELMGFNAKDCHNEVFKEINSRRQDPIQKNEWSLGIFLEGKWQKDKKQPPDTLYSADYNRCKFGSKA